MTQKYCLTLSTQKAGKRREIEDNWFHKCREKKIPFITVRQKADNSDIHHDYINLPVEFDGTFFDASGNRLADEIISMYRRFYAQVPESKMSVTTSSCVTWFLDVPNAIAPSLAKELFDLISLRCHKFSCVR